jgi:hypothetical protein
MDFITLATEIDPRRLLRHLDQMLGDDDQYDPTSTGSPASAFYSSVSAEESEVTAPILSKTAEAELYLLATNFLLYVAMVIITTMVAKIYFPELLERGVERDTSIASPRSYDYRVADAQESEDFYGSDDENGDDAKELLDSDSGEDEDKKERDILGKPGLLEFHDSMTKVQVLRRLLFCSLMLNITFVMWGALQVSNVQLHWSCSSRLNS